MTRDFLDEGLLNRLLLLFCHRCQ